jgi:hypothetical protein
MIHDLPLESEDQTIICQIDFVNVFQTKPYSRTFQSFKEQAYLPKL